MGLLYHWRKENYEDDMTRIQQGHDLSLVQNSRRWEAAENGETVWAFTRNNNGRYVLVATYDVDHVEDYDGDYGRYCAVAIADTTEFYDPKVGDDIEPIIRGLPFSLKNPSLGRNFQGPAAVKKVELADEEGLRQFAAKQQLL